MMLGGMTRYFPTLNVSALSHICWELVYLIVKYEKYVCITLTSHKQVFARFDTTSWFTSPPQCILAQLYPHGSLMSSSPPDATAIGIAILPTPEVGLFAS